jgi:hypothetical protein
LLRKVRWLRERAGGNALWLLPGLLQENARGGVELAARGDRLPIVGAVCLVRLKGESGRVRRGKEGGVTVRPSFLSVLTCGRIRRVEDGKVLAGGGEVGVTRAGYSMRLLVTARRGNRWATTTTGRSDC